jgi:tripartite-type tricarboxylate transporter receptor subunit TctC
MAAVLAAVTAAPVLAQMPAAAPAYPTQPIRLLVGYAPGGPTDIIARLVATRLQEVLGQTVVVENKAGASSNIASEEVARAKPDGHTLLLGTIANATNMTFYKKMNYDTLRSFAPITQLVASPSVLMVNATLPVRTVSELIALGKAKPGTLSFASSGNGGSPHLGGELLKMRTGMDMIHVPYKGTAPAMNALLSGEVSMSFVTSLSAIPQAKNPKLRALAVAGQQRLPQLPEVPTLIESGLAGFEVSSWSGLMAPAGTPPAIIARLNAETTKILALPEVRATLLAQAALPVGSTPDQFRSYIAEEIDRWGKVIKLTGATLE